MRRNILSIVLAFCAALMAVSLPARAAGNSTALSPLEQGYRNMYNLAFADAHREFRVWQQQHPNDPLGPVSDAAAYLFSEFDRLHILEVELFIDDTRFETRNKPVADPQVKQAFAAQLTKAKQLADVALAKDPQDANALFASVLTFGLEGDYLAMIEKRDLHALSSMKQGRALAQKLLAIEPTKYDAYLAIGVENYLLSLRSSPVRWMLRLGGAQTDKEAGLQKLKITAERGHYLLPYARMLLAVAALRDHDREQARVLLEGLAREFPHNHLYSQELARLR